MYIVRNILIYNNVIRKNMWTECIYYAYFNKKKYQNIYNLSFKSYLANLNRIIEKF